MTEHQHMPNMDVDTGGRFEMIRALGAGAFGEVKLVREVSTQTMLAMKVLKRRDVDTHEVNEIINHSLLRHPHVVQFREMFLTQDHVCILMEYANGGSLFDMVSKERKLREPLARWFFQQLILAMDYCHKMGVANRDIKVSMPFGTWIPQQLAAYSLSQWLQGTNCLSEDVLPLPPLTKQANPQACM